MELIMIHPDPTPSVTILDITADGLTIGKHDDITGTVSVEVEFVDARDQAGRGQVDVTLTADDVWVDRSAQDDWETAATVREMYDAIEAEAIEAAWQVRFEVAAEVAEARRVEAMLDQLPDLAGSVKVGHWLTVLSPGHTRRILVAESRRDEAAVVSLVVMEPAKMPVQLRAA